MKTIEVLELADLNNDQLKTAYQHWQGEILPTIEQFALDDMLRSRDYFLSTGKSDGIFYGEIMVAEYERAIKLGESEEIALSYACDEGIAAYRGECDYLDSLEYFRNDAEANGYTFNRYGKIIFGV
jgi:hypothetical protein